MAIFLEYIKGINSEEDTISKIYFPPITYTSNEEEVITNYPMIKLFNESNSSLKADLGEIVTTKGDMQFIDKLNVNILQIDQLQLLSTIITKDLTISDGNKLIIGDETDPTNGGILTVTNQITSGSIQANTIISNSSIQVKDNDYVVCSFDVDSGILTTNSITFEV